MVTSVFHDLVPNDARVLARYGGRGYRTGVPLLDDRIVEHDSMTDRKGFRLEQERRFQASQQRVFEALTEPSRLTKWWGPNGFTTPEVRLDLRVGGSYRFTMQPPDGEAFHLSGEFLAVDPFDRISFTFRWDEPDPDDRETVVVLRLRTAGGATTVSLSQETFLTEGRLELHREGWTESFDKLDGVLQTGKS
jgi:uncharacterized protein YndB with AHSA1/START domain